MGLNSLFLILTNEKVMVIQNNNRRIITGVFLITALFLILTIVYSFIPPKTIDYTEIEYGVIIDTPTPNKMDPVKITAYLYNNQTRTVYIAPFDYSWNFRTMGYWSTLVGTGIIQKEVLKLRPDETVILREKTIYPTRNGTLLIDVLGPIVKVKIENPDTVNLLEYMEKDEKGQLNVTQSKVYFSDVNRMEHDVYLFTELTEPVSSFRAEFSVLVNEIEPSRYLFNRINVFTVSNLVGDYRFVRFNGSNELCVRIQSNVSGNYYEIEVRENSNFTTNPVKGDYHYNVNQTYYYRFERDELTATLYVYLDREYFELAERLVLHQNYSNEYSVIMFPQCGGYSAGNYTISGVLGALFIK